MVSTAAHDVAPVARANKPPTVTEELNAVKLALAQGLTAPAIIRIEVSRLLAKQLR
jgi:hypothetical protein